jgi:hypothetical protein
VEDVYAWVKPFKMFKVHIKVPLHLQQVWESLGALSHHHSQGKFVFHATKHSFLLLTASWRLRWSNQISEFSLFKFHFKLKFKFRIHQASLFFLGWLKCQIHLNVSVRSIFLTVSWPFNRSSHFLGVFRTFCYKPS